MQLDEALNAGGDYGIDFTLGIVPCYVAGTRIALAQGERDVAALRIGDTVKTLHAGLKQIKWIGRRSYDGRFIEGNPMILPVCLQAGAIAPKIPARDLWVSPGHAVYLDGRLVPAARLVNGISIFQARRVERVDYFHIELDTHEVIFAESCPAESFYDDACRNQFQNAAEFHGHDSGVPPAAPLERCEAGFWLAVQQRRLAVRAGIRLPKTQPGPLRGFVDQAGPGAVSGWAQDETAPEIPVCLEILVNGRRAGRVLANAYRADLRAAGLGSGCHGFGFHLPQGVSGEISVHRAADGAVLALTEKAEFRLRSTCF